MAINYPSTFMIETVLGCNLACPCCAVGGGFVKRPYGHLTYEKYLSIAEKIKPHCKYLYLHIWGEPLLNPEIFKMIQDASSFTRVNISTNANTLTRERSEELIASGVHDLIVSIDGMSQECYSIYRKKGNLKKSLDALRWLAEYAGYKRPKAWNIFRKMELVKTKVNIIPQYIVFKHNEHEMVSFASFCSDLGLKAMFKAPYLNGTTELRSVENPEYVRSIERDPFKRAKLMSKCKDLKDVFTVLLDGSVVPCCYDHDGDVILGNIFEQNIEKIILSPTRTQFRENLKKGTPPEFCLKKCLSW